jgi:hypothetical protein
MKNILLFGLLIISAFLTACSGEEDTEEFSGILDKASAWGYEYKVTKNQEEITWEVGYKDHISVLEEIPANEENLELFRTAVSDIQSERVDLILSLCYFLIVVIIALFLFRKNRKLLKETGPFMAVFTAIAIYIAFGASADLINSLQDAKYYYSLIIH